ncbi:hypothetical protein I308_101551 [Cryptococcus tetragattii IND107]|uniref:Uncharacterized protein n=1 Tax=Cryptococcus tetragattii IND107 TaxID=1296105 RepID=A0ABR3C0M5_9TREE
MHRKNPEKALTVCICVVIDNNDLALTLIAKIKAYESFSFDIDERKNSYLQRPYPPCFLEEKLTSGLYIRIRTLTVEKLFRHRYSLALQRTRILCRFGCNSILSASPTNSSSVWALNRAVFEIFDLVDTASRIQSTVYLSKKKKNSQGLWVIRPPAIISQ